MPLSNQGQLELLRAMMTRGLPLRMPVRGSSMAPRIRDEDVVTVVPLERQDPTVGQVIAFVTPLGGHLALHRVVAQRAEGWVLRGDNCHETDGVVARGAMLGRVARVERDGRDVEFGEGRVGVAIAWLGRTGLPLGLRSLRRAPRRLASAALRRLQGVRVYRALGRRWGPRVEIVEAGEADMQSVRRWLDPEDSEPDAPRPADSGVKDWVAKHRSRIVGFVQLVPFSDVHPEWRGHWLSSLNVRGRYRGLGVGEALTARVVEEARAQGVAELLLVVSEDNERAIGLYRKAGFSQTVVEALEPIFQAEKASHGRRRVVMRKRLDGSA